MKRISKIIVSSLIIILMIIGGGYSIYYFSRPSEDKRIITTIFPIYDITRNVMGSDDEIMLLEDTGVDVHSFSPSLRESMHIRNADLFVYIGGESDKWVADLLNMKTSDNFHSLNLFDRIEKLEESDNNIADTDHHTDDDHSGEQSDEIEYDEHIWLSVKNIINMTRIICDKLIEVYPERCELFETNANSYIAKMQTLESEYENVCANKVNKLIFADRFPFLYLIKDYNLNYFACFKGCSTESEASYEVKRKVIDEINTNDVDYVLVLETSDQNLANSIINNSKCKEGVEILVLNSCQSVTRNEAKHLTLIKILEDNLEVLKKVLTK